MLKIHFNKTSLKVAIAAINNAAILIKGSRGIKLEGYIN